VTLALKLGTEPLSLDRHALFTFRNLTRRVPWFIERLTMRVITLKRTVRKRTPYRRSLVLRSFRNLSRGYFSNEKSREFVIEALLFAVIVAISAWPIFAAADALNEFLQCTPN
jgi:hypothetical protein